VLARLLLAEGQNPIHDLAARGVIRLFDGLRRHNTARQADEYCAPTIDVGRDRLHVRILAQIELRGRVLAGVTTDAVTFEEWPDGFGESAIESGLGRIGWGSGADRRYAKDSERGNLPS
jgi:hypothetical protein